MTIVPTLSIRPSATDLVPYQNASANAENTLKNWVMVKDALLFIHKRIDVTYDQSKLQRKKWRCVLGMHLGFLDR